MKALTITEPYASLIREGVKKIETRSWKTNYRGEILIHASAKMPTKSTLKKWGLSVREYWKLLEYIEHVLPSYITCKAKLVDCVEITEEFIDSLSDVEKQCGFYSVGRYAWILEDIEPVDPVKAKGHLGIWDYSHAVYPFRYWTACRETGSKIESFRTKREAIEQIRKYEEEDKLNGSYTPDFYDIVDDEFMSVKW